MKGLGLGLSLTGPSGVAAFNPASLFTASAGGAYDPAQQSGVDAGVSSFTDVSGNGNHATQATAANRPILRSSGDKQYLEFDGTDDVLTFPVGLLSGWTSGTLLFGARRLTDPPAGGFGPVLGNFSAGENDHWGHSDGVVYIGSLSSSRRTAGDPGDLAAWHVGEVRSAAGSYAVAFNGTDFFTDTSNTFATGTGPSIGWGTSSGFYLGSIGRILIIDRVLSGDDLANARAWIAAGYS